MFRSLLIAAVLIAGLSMVSTADAGHRHRHHRGHHGWHRHHARHHHHYRHHHRKIHRAGYDWYGPSYYRGPGIYW